MSPLRSLPAVACVAALLLTGCGGSGKQLSVAQYHRRGNEICQRSLGQLRTLKHPTSVKQLGPYLDRADGDVRSLVDQLKQLNPPSSLKDTHGQAVALAGKLESTFHDAAGKAKSAKTQADAAKAFSGDVRTQLNTIGGQLSAKLGQLGLKSCIQ